MLIPKKHKLVHTLTLPLVLSQLLGASAVYAHETPTALVDTVAYAKCQQVKFDWLFSDFNPDHNRETRRKTQVLEHLNEMIQSYDLIRTSDKELVPFFEEGLAQKVPTEVLQSLVCIERAKKINPTLEQHKYECGQSCAVTIK